MYIMNNSDILGYIVFAFILGACIYIYMQTDDFQLKCIVSTVDGNKYCVREREKIQAAADLLATATEKCKQIVAYTAKKFPDQENVKRLVQNFNPQKIIETLPTSNYTAYSENKGEKIAFCLNKTKGGKENLIDEHTLTFVAIHEIAHTMTKSIGHKSEFWENFKFLLENAKEAGIHDPANYKKSPQKYCGMTIHDNPYFDI
jgi:predicted metal-dependent hydrolase